MASLIGVFLQAQEETFSKERVDGIDLQGELKAWLRLSQPPEEAQKEEAEELYRFPLLPLDPPLMISTPEIITRWEKREKLQAQAEFEALKRDKGCGVCLLFGVGVILALLLALLFKKLP